MDSPPEACAEPSLHALAQLVHHDLAHLPLLLFNRKCRVDDVEAHLVRHGFVFVQNAALENAEALFHVARQPQVHAGLIVFDRIAAAQDASQRHIQRYPEVEGRDWDACAKR